MGLQNKENAISTVCARHGWGEPRLPGRWPKQLLLLPGSGRRDPPLPGLSIDTRFVRRILVFERMVCLASQTRSGLRAQDLLQRRDGAGVLWLGAQPTYGMFSHTPVRIFERHPDEQADEIS